CRIFLGQNLIGRGVDLFKVSSSYELLNQCEMRSVRRVQSKACWIRLEKAGIVGLRMLNHRRVRLEQDVDSRDSAFLRIGCVNEAEQRRQAHAEGSKDFRVFADGSPPP